MRTEYCTKITGSGDLSSGLVSEIRRLDISSLQLLTNYF